MCEQIDLAEAQELCRDPDSTGCDLEMMDALMAAEAKKAVAKPARPRWSAEIDDAVFKTD